jgi:trehalose 2-sulfotransferase
MPQMDYGIFSGNLRQYESELEASFARPVAEATKPFPKPAAPLERAYFICFVNRSGSMLLADGLARTKRLGRPGEFFNPEPVAKARQEYGVGTIGAYLDLCVARTTSKNGVFGAKVGIHQLAHLADRGLLWTGLGAPRFVYVTREDLVMQAISLFIAWQTNAWTSNNQPEREPEYDAEGIGHQLRSIARTQAEFEAFFAAHRIRPLRLTYEQLAENLPGAVHQVADHLGVEISAVSRYDGKLKVQRTERNRQWAERFVATFRPAADS